MILFLRRVCFSQTLLTLCTLLWWDRVVAYSSEELALLQFAGQITNFKVRYVMWTCAPLTYSSTATIAALHLSLSSLRYIAHDTVRVYLQDIAAAYQWHGWGLDNNTLCPPAQISTRQEVLCEPEYPGDIDQASQSWTGITCTPDGHVTCLSLPGYGLSGNISLLRDLAPLKDMQLLNIANNSFTGELVLTMPYIEWQTWCEVLAALQVGFAPLICRCLASKSTV